MCTAPLHHGPRWMLDIYFYRGRDGAVASWCKTCIRINTRKRAGMKRRGEPFQPRKVRMTPEQRRARKRDLMREKMKDPAFRENRREEQRVRLYLKAHKAGVKQRELKRLAPPPQPKRAVMYDCEPMTEKIVAYMKCTGIGGTRIAAKAGLDEKYVRRILRGEYQQLTLDVADRLAMAMGSHIDIIYGKG